MRSIAFIIPYIGKLRTDFQFWKASVQANSTIDFFLFTDAEVTDPPANLHVHRCCFDDLKSLFQKQFDFQININRPYKFCDFRPAYGEVFAEYLKGYDFWGYTDMDMVYGDLRKWLTDELLDKYNHIFGRGHMSLYRNQSEINSIYRQIQEPSYKQVFTFSEGCAFDEYYGTSRYWDIYLKEMFYEAFPYDDIDAFVYPFESHMRRKEDAGCKNFIYAYNEGKLFRIYEKGNQVCKTETMYVHFQKRSMGIKVESDDRFLMIPNAYIPYEEVEDPARLAVLGNRSRIYPHFFRLQMERVRNKIQKVLTSNFSKEFGKPELPNATRYYQEK